MKNSRGRWRDFSKKVAMLVAAAAILVNSVERVHADGQDVPEELSDLYAQSAVLMDADSGRVLFGKNEEKQKPMASTTKIMTCILALEKGDLTDTVTVSAEAVKQPKVHLGMREGEQFYLKDLLYSLMLESHNDSAVAIAEHIGGSVPKFAEMMNAKAKELGCDQTYFVTPNGLDQTDQNGTHSTTAADLARIMKYCISESPRRGEFLGITGQAEYQFADVTGSRTFSSRNHNTFLTIMEGAFSGKTGFTSDAGYCYVGALKQDGKTLIVALLGCGWPNNRSYKWKDTLKLMKYGLANYQLKPLWQNLKLPEIEVENGIPETKDPFGDATAQLEVKATKEEREQKVLLREDEKAVANISCQKTLEAPLKSKTRVGKVTYQIGDSILAEYPIQTSKTIKPKSFRWCFRKIAEIWLGQ